MPVYANSDRAGHDMVQVLVDIAYQSTLSRYLGSMKPMLLAYVHPVYLYNAFHRQRLCPSVTSLEGSWCLVLIGVERRVP